MNFVGRVTSEYQVPKRLNKYRKNGPFVSLKAFKKELDKHFRLVGCDVAFCFNEVIDRVFAIYGEDHMNIQFFPAGVTKEDDQNMREHPQDYEYDNSGLLPLLWLISDHLVLGAQFSIYYTGEEGLRPPLCGMAWHIFKGRVVQIDICDHKGLRCLRRPKKEKRK